MCIYILAASGSVTTNKDLFLASACGGLVASVPLECRSELCGCLHAVQWASEDNTYSEIRNY